ncbi:hypothetical protein A8B75_15940 [Sphingomonadales bacterium EhC05]|jgi:hypothetical protein|nr:hypothetical protein A8B75_15940 [Sphingomonadales bacterium EhC05]
MLVPAFGCEEDYQEPTEVASRTINSAVCVVLLPASLWNILSCKRPIFRNAASLLTCARCFPKRTAPWRVGLLFKMALFGGFWGVKGV